MSEKICLFAGTTEGRSLAALLSGRVELTVCVATEYGEVLLDDIPELCIHTGRMDCSEMNAFFMREKFTLVVDATHPYADKVTENIKAAAEQAGIRVIRVLRDEDAHIEEAVYVSSAKEAASFLAGTQGNILLTTGSKELVEFGIVESGRLWARVLPVSESLRLCAESGIEVSRIIAMQGPFSEQANIAHLQAVNAKYLVTKESGKNGGFEEKISAAEKTGAVPVIIGRPPQTEGMTYREAVLELDRLLGTVRKVKVRIIGIGAGSPDCLTEQARKIISGCDCLIGAKRVTSALSSFGKPHINEIDPQKIRQKIEDTAEYTTFAAVMSGDVGFYSGAKKLSEVLDGYEIAYIPGISSVGFFAARLTTSWDDVKLMSLHGRYQNIVGTVKRNRRTLALTGGENDVSSICRRLCEYGLGDVWVTVGERLSYPEERLVKGYAHELCEACFDSLSVMLIENDAFSSGIPQGIGDDEFIRSQVPMTKSEVRAVSLSKLRLNADSVVYDVGAGTGSVSMECALAAYEGVVYAIEKNPIAVQLIRENARKFAAENIEVIEGTAPEAMDGLPVPTHAFIGGSSGNMHEIISCLLEKNRGVSIVVNALTLETITETLECIRKFGFEHYEISSIGVSRSKKLGSYTMMESLNSVYVIWMKNDG